jgi:ADP-heptose:LPS heptosyltransferase
MLAFFALPTWLVVLWRKFVETQALAPNYPDAVRSILVIRLDQLGDVILTTPLFRELKRLYPASRCTVVVRPQHRAILTTNRNVDEILTLGSLQTKWLPQDARQLASTLWLYWAKLRHRQFDLVISPRWDVDEDLATMLCALANATSRIGYSSRATTAKRRFNRGFDAAFDVLLPPGPLQHELERNLAVVEALGGHVSSRRLEIRLSESDRKVAAELFQHHDGGRLLVALGIGGGAPGRKWPLERFAQAVAQLNHLRPVQPVIVCSGEEDNEASALSMQLPVPPYILSGLPLRVVCAVLARCDVFLGNDSGPGHLAAAMDCPTVVVSRHPADGDLSHANSPVRFAPRCPRYRVLQPATGCDDCIASCRSAEPHCILQVTVERAVEAALELLPRPVPALKVCVPSMAAQPQVQFECSLAEVAVLA